MASVNNADYADICCEIEAPLSCMACDSMRTAGLPFEFVTMQSGHVVHNYDCRTQSADEACLKCS